MSLSAQVISSLRDCRMKPGGARPQAEAPCARWQQAEQFVVGVIGDDFDPVGLLPALPGVEVLHGWQLQPDDALSSFHQPL